MILTVVKCISTKINIQTIIPMTKYSTKYSKKNSYDLQMGVGSKLGMRLGVEFVNSARCASVLV